MIEQVFDFVVNHFVLVGIFAALVVAFLVNEGKRGGASVTTNTLVNMVNRENAVILDIRDNKDFKAGHIVDAITLLITSPQPPQKEEEEYSVKKVF